MPVCVQLNLPCENFHKTNLFMARKTDFAYQVTILHRQNNSWKESSFQSRNVCLHFPLPHTQSLEESLTRRRFYEVLVASKNSEQMTCQPVYGIQNINVKCTLFKSDEFKDFLTFLA